MTEQLIPAEVIETCRLDPPPIDLYLVAGCDRLLRWKIPAHPAGGWTSEQAKREMRRMLESGKWLAVSIVHVGPSVEAMRAVHNARQTAQDAPGSTNAEKPTGGAA